MQFCPRRLAPGEIDHELIWLGVSLSSLAVAAAWFGLGLPWPRCAFHDITGLPCVTCGATRTAIAFFHGNISSAWKWNPLVFAFLCGLSTFDVNALTVVVTRAPRLRIGYFSSAEKTLLRALFIILFVSNWPIYCCTGAILADHKRFIWNWNAPDIIVGSTAMCLDECRRV